MRRILDFSTDLHGRYATRLLADQGFEVVCVRLLNGGEIGPSVATVDLAPLEDHLGRNKVHIDVDISTPAGRRDLAEALAGADTVVHTFTSARALGFGLGAQAVAAAGVRTLLTLTPFGFDGEGADRPASEKTLQALGGAMLISGGAEALERGEPPLDLNLPMIGTFGGIYGAMSLLARYYGVRREADPGFAHIDLALRDLAPANLEKVIASFTYLGVVMLRGTRGGRMQENAGLGEMKAKDGYFHVYVLREAFRKLAELIGRDDLANDPAWADPRRRTYTDRETSEVCRAAIAELTLEQLSERASMLKMPSGPILEIEDLMDRAQLRHREALTVADGRIEIEEPYRFRNAPRVRGRSRKASSLAALAPPGHERLAAPVAKEARRDGPLQGVRVLDLTQAYAGPSSTRILAELGAEVIKIEAVGRLDIYPRVLIPFQNNTEGDLWERAGYFAERNLNKKGITLDLSVDAGRDIFRQLVAHADVVSSNYTPRVMPGWGFGPDQLLAINPRLVVLAISGFGATGPDSEMPALAGLIEATSGFTSRVRYRQDQGPVDVGFAFGDMVSGLYSALSVLLALERRDRTGLGDAIDMSCVEAPLPFLAAAITEWARTGAAPPVEREIVPGGRHLFIRCGGEHERWVIAFEPADRHGQVAQVVGGTERQGLRASIDTGLSPVEAVARLGAAGLLNAPLYDGEQLLFDRALHRRRVFDVVDRPGVGPLPHARTFPMLLNGEPMGVALAPPPRLGQHNEAVLGGLLKMSPAQLAAFKAADLIGDKPSAPLQSVLRTPVPLAELAALKRLRLSVGAAERLAKAFGYSGDSKLSA